jgi:2-oxoglutarate dehydrogenase E2 component (dihydrolipoamide succinyltransferase)
MCESAFVSDARPDPESDVLPHRRRAPRPVRLRAPRPARRATAAAAVPEPVDHGADERLPFSATRKRAAVHLVESKAVSAHATTMVEVDFAAVARVRKGRGLTYLPYIARAVIEAVADFPMLNATVADGVLVAHQTVHLGIAVDLDYQGLVVPVLHDAATLTLEALGAGITDLAERARNRRLRPEDVTGGTFTITNPGPFGTFRSVPIINQPQVAILATDAVRPRPVVVADDRGADAFAVHPVGNLALSFDARVVTLDEAAGFVAHVRDSLETWS